MTFNGFFVVHVFGLLFILYHFIAGLCLYIVTAVRSCFLPPQLMFSFVCGI